MDNHRNGATVEPGGVGPLLRRWRESRHLSQLDLALEAEVSARHISFLETGRAEPSREMLLTLANVLDVPLRERNFLLLAAGYAPIYGDSKITSPERIAPGVQSQPDAQDHCELGGYREIATQ
jgi:transcriptional regulator with XRE-family HTH domain